MKVTAERIPESQVVLDVELDDERVERALNQAARRLSQRFLIPGFRKGKAPRQVVERVLSVDAVFEEATERLVPQALQEAIEGEGLEPIAVPQVEITGREPMTFRATVPLEPTVELGDYRSIAVARPDSDYTEELVDEQISGAAASACGVGAGRARAGNERPGHGGHPAQTSKTTRCSTSRPRSSTCARASRSVFPG